MLKKTPLAPPTTEEKFNGASALAGAATSYFAGIIADLLNANAELAEVGDETSEQIDTVNDETEAQIELLARLRDAEVDRLSALRDAAAERLAANVGVILNLRRIVGDIA